MKALVTGSSGFIGSTLVEKLTQTGHQVVCLIRRNSSREWLNHLPVTFCQADLMSGEGIAQALAGVDWVFHLAGVTKAKKRQGYLDGNVIPTQQLLRACSSAADLKKFIHISSQAAAGPSLPGIPLTEDDEPHPISIYGESKWLAEKEVMKYSGQLPVTILRPPSVYGPKDRDILTYFRNVKKGFVLVLGKGTQQISIVHVTDLVQAMILAAENPASCGKVFFVAGDGHFDWQTIGSQIAQALEKKVVTIHVPVWMLSIVSQVSLLASRFSARPALLNQDKVREMIQPSWLCSNERAKRELGFHPQVSLEQGVAETAAWYREKAWL